MSTPCRTTSGTRTTWPRAGRCSKSAAATATSSCGSAARPGRPRSRKNPSCCGSTGPTATRRRRRGNLPPPRGRRRPQPHPRQQPPLGVRMMARPPPIRRQPVGVQIVRDQVRARPQSRNKLNNRTAWITGGPAGVAGHAGPGPAPDGVPCPGQRGAVTPVRRPLVLGLC
jgi:hypothetical protein